MAESPLALEVIVPGASTPQDHRTEVPGDCLIPGKEMTQPWQIALALSSDPDNPTATTLFTNQVLWLAHTQLIREREQALQRAAINKPDELLTEDQVRLYGLPDIEEPRWLARCYQKAYSMLNVMEKLTGTSRLELFCRIEAGGLYHYAGYESLAEWFISESDRHAPHGGYHKDLKFVATILVPTCASLGVFQSPQDMGNWFRISGHLRRLRPLVPALRFVILRSKLPPVQQRAKIRQILGLITNPRVNGEALADLANFNGRKPTLHVTALPLNGSGEQQYVVGSIVNDHQLQSLKDRLHFSAVVKTEEPEKLPMSLSLLCYAILEINASML